MLILVLLLVVPITVWGLVPIFTYIYIYIYIHIYIYRQRYRSFERSCVFYVQREKLSITWVDAQKERDSRLRRSCTLPSGTPQVWNAPGCSADVPFHDLYLRTLGTSQTLGSDANGQSPWSVSKPKHGLPRTWTLGAEDEWQPQAVVVYLGGNDWWSLHAQGRLPQREIKRNKQS